LIARRERVAAKVDPGFAQQPARTNDQAPANRFIRFATGSSALQEGRAALMCSIMPKFADIAADFAFLEDWDERYKYLIDLGRALAPYPSDKRDDAHKVKGCASQVWLHPRLETKGGRQVLAFDGDSDAHIVKGLVALLIHLYTDKTPAEIAALDAAAALAPLDLEGHLTPQRSNGLAAMARRIGEIAAASATGSAAL
jgi:cysteine desulfuration protein SufE